MTKRKFGVFRGGWLVESVTCPSRIPTFLNDEQRRELIDAQRLAEDRARDELRLLIENHGYGIQPAPILGELLRQAGIYRFEAERIAVEPAPAEWAGLIAEIEIPERPSWLQALEVRRRVGRLPLHALAVLDTLLFRAISMGRVGLLQRLCEAPSAEDAQLLRQALADMVEELSRLKGKRGPRLDVGPAFRALTAVILANSSLKVGPAHQLAAELLRACGIKCPSSRGQLSKLAK
ncbi:hypothetical protein FQZ97_860770 [compost metagenome]